MACSPSRVVARSRRLLLIETLVPEALRRLAYTSLVLDFLGIGTPDRLPFAAAEEIQGTYAVRATGIPASLRQALYRLVWHALPAPRVALRDPDTELHAFVVSDGVWWGRLRQRVGSSNFAARQTQRRPFFRSYGMQPREARCLVNLSGAQPGQRLLDPCSGTGAYPIEAALMGIDAYASDSDTRAVDGTRANLRAFGLEAHLRRLDARRLDAWGMTFDAVVTDLPYGRSASLAGIRMVELYREILQAAALVLPRGRVGVFVAPLGMLPAAPDHFVVLEQHLEFVHESLTREITVLCRR